MKEQKQVFYRYCTTELIGKIMALHKLMFAVIISCRSVQIAKPVTAVRAT